MALTQLAPPYPIFTDKSGSPLDAGYLYFGEVNKNPETNPIQVYYDRGFTQPVAQPVRTSNGYIMRNGSPALIYADSQFSVTVRNRNSELVIYSPVGYGVTPGIPFATFENAARDVAALLSDTQFTYSAGVPNTVQVTAGDILRTLAEGFAYEVAASGATDVHVTTAGGVKLYVQPGADGFDVMAFGAHADGTTDDTSFVELALRVAAASPVRKAKFQTKHLVTDVNLTKLFYSGLMIEGMNLTHQPSPDVATFIVTGAASQGFDISGSSGIVWRNVSIRGDAVDTPRCAIFAQRISGSPESFGHSFEEVRIFGDFTDAGVYNFAGEFWSWENSILWCEGGGGRAFYYTSTNSLGRSSKFETPDSTVTPLTISSFRKCDFRGTGNEVGWFEAPAVAGLDTTIQNIVFDGCYSRARGFGGGGNVFRFTEVFGSMVFRDCTDESFATGDSTAAATVLRFDGARVFRGLRIEGNNFYHRAYNAIGPTGFIVNADCPVFEYSADQNWTSQGSRYRFANLSNAYHKTLFAPASFEAVAANLVDVEPGNRASLANIILPSNRMSRAFDWSYPGSPQGNVNPERRNTSILNTYDSTLWVPVGDPSGVDSFSWLELMVRRAGSGLPTSGTFPAGALRWKSVPTAGGKVGWVNLSDGTAGTLNGGATTGSISSGSTTLTVNSATDLSLGVFIAIAGVSGRKRVVGISGTTVTIDVAADATVAGAAVSFFAPAWKEFGAIDP